MPKPFPLVATGLASVVAFLVGFAAAGRSTGETGRVTTAPEPAAIEAPAAAVVRPPALGPDLSVSFADVAAALNPAVVNVEAVSRATRGRSRWPSTRHPRPDTGDPSSDDLAHGTGSGVIIEPDGHILTNHHVVDGADRVVVRLADGRSFRARVIGGDPAIDIALIKIEAGQPLTAAPLGDSSTLRVGEWVCAIGNPLAYEHTVTVGVVSYLGRKLFDASLDSYIQTDAAINFGSSGGPLINTRGEVVGITTAVSWRASNIGFAVPINQATEVLPQLKSRGRVSRGYIGVTLRDVDVDLVESLGLRARRGALVEEVIGRSPAERAGLRAYDVILGVDDERVGSHDELVRRVAARRPGTTAALRIERDGREQVVHVRLAERPGSAPGREAASPGDAAVPASDMGLSVRGLDRQLGRQLELPPGLSGVVVVDVDPASAAADAGFTHGDVVLEINRRPVGSVADYEAMIGRAPGGSVLAFLCYVPELGQRALRTVRLESVPR